MWYCSDYCLDKIAQAYFPLVPLDSAFCGGKYAPDEYIAKFSEIWDLFNALGFGSGSLADAAAKAQGLERSGSMMSVTASSGGSAAGQLLKVDRITRAVDLELLQQTTCLAKMKARDSEGRTALMLAVRRADPIHEAIVEEGDNVLFCPSQEKFQTAISRVVRRYF